MQGYRDVAIHLAMCAGVMERLKSSVSSLSISPDVKYGTMRQLEKMAGHMRYELRARPLASLFAEPRPGGSCKDTVGWFGITLRSHYSIIIGPHRTLNGCPGRTR